MNRQDFMNRLAADLSKLPKEEVQAAMEYYSEYFDEAGPENEAQAIKDAGSPGKIATQIKADYAVRQLDQTNKTQSTKKGLHAILLVILGVFAAPIALPLAIAFGAVLFAFFITFVAIAGALIACFGAACVTGIVLIIVGIVGLTGSISGGIMLIGYGLVTSGIMALLCVGVVVAAKALVRVITKQLQKSSETRRMRKISREVKKDEQ